MTTFAPCINPRSLPSAAIVPRDVVDGMSAFGNISLSMLIITSVCLTVPCSIFANGVSL